MLQKKLITSESVGPGHPDKICDQISDSILDACLAEDENSRVACEVFASNRLIVIGGEITTKAYVDVVKVAWSVLKKLSYDENDFTIVSNINSQSPDIAQKVNINNTTLGAGDQGMVYGYACDETSEYLPLSYVLSNELLKQLVKQIDNKKLIGFKYDMKSQVTVDYTNPKKPSIDTVVVSVQHDAKVSLNKLRKDIDELVITSVLKKFKLNTDCKKMINHGGTFIIGGPIGDTGLTGRKIMVDTYGSVACHGGGAFSGKDYTKVDRTGAYFARYIAKHIVAAKLAKVVQLQLSFCIGATKPISMHIETFNTNAIELNKIYDLVNKTFDFELSNIVKHLQLKKSIFKKTSVFGHFTNKDMPWEKLDKIKLLMGKK